MDLLPIPPKSTNKVDTSINLANDGGSKSNTGYFSQRGKSEKKEEEAKVDEVSFSSSQTLEDEIEVEVESALKGFINNIKNFILNLLGFKREETVNIFQKNSR